MDWHFEANTYIVTGDQLTKESDGGAGAVGLCQWPSDKPREFKVIIHQHMGVRFECGVADATSKEKLKEGAAAFGVRIQSDGRVHSWTDSDAIRGGSDEKGELLHDHDEVSEIRASVQGRRLLMSFDGGEFVDTGHDLPHWVAPWVVLRCAGGKIEFTEKRDVPLQVFAQMGAGSITVLCAKMGGEEAGTIGGLGLDDVGSALAALVHRSVPAPPDAQWKIVLPSGAVLENDEATLTLRALFGFEQASSEAVRERPPQEGLPKAEDSPG